MLPKLEHPTFDLIIPSTKVKYQFRPYTVKEQKILLLMQAVNSADELAQLILQLIESCYVATAWSTPFNVQKLTYFDVEYLFLKIRTKSVSDETTIAFRCNNTITDGTICGEINNLKVRLDDIEITVDTDLAKSLQIGPDLFLSLNYPSIQSAQYLENYNSTKDTQHLFQAIRHDLNCIMSNDKIYDDFEPSELDEFLNNLDLKAFKLILEFYVNTPTLKKIINFTCKKCGYNDTIVLSGLVDFFV